MPAFLAWSVQLLLFHMPDNVLQPHGTEKQLLYKIKTFLSSNFYLLRDKRLSTSKQRPWYNHLQP